MTCFESGGNGRARSHGKSRVQLKEKILIGLDAIASLVIRYLDTPFLLVGCITHVVSPASNCVCATCKSRIDRGLNAFAQRLLAVLPILCFAPYRLPEKLWRKIFPPPCNHNRCKLRKYVSPPPPWYHRFKAFYQPIERQYRGHTAPPQVLSSFPFLNLPPELRKQIYLHASHANTTHSIHIASKWRAEKYATMPLAEHDASGHSVNTRQAVPSEDATSYQLNGNGIIAVHGAPPPTNLLQVNRQVYDEATEAFWSTTAFEVQPLTPNDACWRLDQSLRPTYEALAKSKYAKNMRKVRVRIDVARFSMGRQCKRFERANAQVCTFEEIELEECAKRLGVLAGDLCEVLTASAPSLRVIEVKWVDEFGREVGEKDLRMRANVLVPFVSLAGVRVRIKRLVMPETEKGDVMMMARQVLHCGA